MEPEPQNESALRQQITQMQEQIQLMQQALSSSAPSVQTPSDTYTTPYHRPKPILPNPPKFGGDRRVYEAWKAEITSKLDIDAQAIGPPSNQFAYINSRLEGAAQQMCLAFFQSTAQTPAATPADFLAYLDRSYADPNRKLRATTLLRTMKQKESTFAGFLPRFEKALADAGAATWAEDAKIAFLEGTLNQDLQRAMLSYRKPATYGEYVTQLLEMDGRLQNLQRTQPYREQQRTTNSKMDWEPTQTVQVHPTQSQAYLSSEDRDKCMKEGRCFRCKEKGHRSAECQQKTQSHTRTKKHVSVTRTKVKEESESDTDHYSEVSSTVALN